MIPSAPLRQTKRIQKKSRVTPLTAGQNYHFSSDLIAVFLKDGSTRMLIRQAVEMLDTASETVESLRLKMDELAATLPEYPVVMAMNGVGSTLGPRFNLSFTLWVLVAEKCTSTKYLVLSIFCC